MKEVTSVSRSVNLDTFIDVFETNDSDLKKSFKKIINNSDDDMISDTEMNDFYMLLVKKKFLSLLSSEKKMGYFFNHTIKSGIREQFDVLRFSGDTVINIELKSQPPSKGIKGIKNQLIRHKFILSTLNKTNVICCAYVTSENKLYMLTEEMGIELIDSEVLARLVPEQYSDKLEIEEVNLSNLIISPYSQPELFKEHRYFLTDDQLLKRNEIIDSRSRLFLIKGGPGTGKTMLLFDLARKYVKEDKRVIIVFAGNKNNHENLSTILGIEIKPVKLVRVSELETYDVIFVDESQRLWEDTFNEFMALQKPRLIFSTDHAQTLSYKEECNNLEQRLCENKSVEVKELSGKIRTDPAMESFIKKFLNLRAKKIQKFEYPKVNVVYFSNKKKAASYIKNLVNQELYVSIELTDYTTKSTAVKKRKKVFSGSETAHSVIGEEYSDVLVPLDEYFFYDDEAKLTSSYSEYYPYSEDRCIFEALTRTKENLLLVVINNPKLFIKIQEILTWKEDDEQKC